MIDPRVVSRDEWLAARRRLLALEKEFTRQRDALNAERRRLPMTEVGKRYAFEGRDGAASLLDLFEGRGQLLIYHFMFDPDWDEGCESCSFLADGTYQWLDLTARGRQEDWEQPPGRSDGPLMAWLRLHDRYDA
jgi:predicted dithiol-disulfide oxidoreductase (DUF899 family)